MKRILAVGMVCLLAGAASAGVWTVVNNDDLVNPLDTSFGTLFKASNLGTSAVPVTVSGIAFDTDTANVIGAVSSPALTKYGGSDPDIANMLTSAKVTSQWGGGTDINLTGLTPGYDYQVQMVMVAAWNGCSLNLYADGADYKYQYFGSGTIEKVITYEFTASDSDITMNIWKNVATVHVQSYAVHEAIPEPATLGLVSILGAGLVYLRRRVFFD